MNLQTYGQHNAFNASMAYLVARLMGLETNSIIASLEEFLGVSGRFELFDHPNGGNIVIDYAHTEDAFKYCLDTLRGMGARRIVHIFGFRGNRDLEKRKKMVITSCKKSDFIILTLDDLNKEKYFDMKRELHSYGLRNKGIIIMDREKAIQVAWGMIKQGDYLLITGKGREFYKPPLNPHLSDFSIINELINQSYERVNNDLK